MSYSLVVTMDWQSTAEGETILQHFYNPQTSGRKFFGLLERPAVPAHVEEVSYKLFVTGSAGVGKSATVARLAGTKCSSVYYETFGIQKTNVYWPVKIWDKLIMFKLQFWDAGHNSRKKYSYILSAGQAKADAIVFVFSFTDRSSFIEFPNAMSILNKKGEDPATIVIGTRDVNDFVGLEGGIIMSLKKSHRHDFPVPTMHKSNTPLEVTVPEVKEFETKYQTNVLKIENKWSSGRNEVHDVAPLLNSICEKLWVRDQDYLYKQGIIREHLPFGGKKEVQKSKNVAT